MTTGRVPQDQSARDRIVKDLDTSFAVEAGAGTGKTSLLTDRIIEAIRTGRSRLSEIVAITFTDRAANELKVRLRDELEKLLAASEGERAQRLSEALAELDTANVSTIHSFASEILRERPVEAGVDPGFEVADALRASLLFEDVWARWLARQLDDANGPLRPAFVAGLTVEQLKEFARFLRDNRDLKPAGEEMGLTRLLGEFVRAFVPRARALDEQMRARCPAPSLCPCASKVIGALNAADQLDARPPDELPARAPRIPKLSTRKPSTRDWYDAKVCGACVAELNDLEKLVAEARGPAAHSLVRRVHGVLREMVGEYETAKRAEALLDFDDLLLKASELLRTNKDVRRYFQQRFKMILVDECQDTDPLQTEIVFFLAEDGATASSWRGVKVAPGRLLFVGDPKQSIYRFRRADIETYEEARQVVAQSGELVPISQNFRSSETCVRWVNAVFAELIRRPDDGSYQPEYVPLDAWRDDAGPGVTVLRPPEGLTFAKIDEARAAEAAAVAAELKAMVERADTVLDKETRAMRPVEYRDVAILFRARTGFNIYENTLGSFGVPFRAVSGRDFFAKQEVLELRVVLTAVERPHDPLAVVAALRTSLIGVSDDELAATADGGFNYLVRSDNGGRSYVDRVFRLFAAWHLARNSSSMSALVQRVLSDTKALELFYLKPGGEQRAANLTKVIDAARAYEQTPGATFGGFVRWLHEMSTAGDEAESPLGEEDGNFVKLITIHKAKGLEFPVVVLADISSDGTRHSNFVVDRREGTFNAQLGGKDLSLNTLGFQDAAEYEKLREEAESRRVFYVAATRARDRLIVPYFPKKDKPGRYLKYLVDLAGDAAAAAGAVQTEVVVDLDDLKPREQQAFRINLSRKPPKECKKLCEDREQWRRGREKLIRDSSVGKRLKTASRLAGDEHEDFRHPREESELGRSIGKAVHAVLEQIDLAAGADLAQLAKEEAALHGATSRQPLVEDLARTALGMELVKRAARAEKLYREVPFAVSVNSTTLEGLIDLAFDDGGGLTIADYKTDDVPEDELAEYAKQYWPQMGAYALAVREVFGELPGSASLLFLRAGREVPVEIDEGLLDSVVKML